MREACERSVAEVGSSDVRLTGQGVCTWSPSSEVEAKDQGLRTFAKKRCYSHLRDHTSEKQNIFGQKKTLVFCLKNTNPAGSTRAHTLVLSPTYNLRKLIME